MINNRPQQSTIGYLRGIVPALLLVCGSMAVAADKPHIVYLIADDLGWKDVGFHGGAIATPHLDKLAEGGAVLNNFYAQPYSSQTRAALLTGRYPMRYGLQTMSILPANQFGLPAEERTLAQALKEVGYKTAFLGKWQLGHSKNEFWPNKRGFDYFYGSLSGDIEPVIKKTTAKLDWRRNEQALKEDGYVTSLLAKDAVSLINKHDAKTPLLLMVAFTAPGAPSIAPKDYLDRHSGISDEARRTYAAAVSGLDDALGSIVAALEKKGMRDDTLIIFHSDNGGALPTRHPTGDGDAKKVAADNGNFREGRGSLYEGGVRVNSLASWSGKIKPATVVTNLAHVTDWYATLLKLAGANPDQPKRPDGVDLWPALTQAQLIDRKEVLINVEDFRGAIRVGEWKLIVHAAMPSKLELFQLSNDPEEAENRVNGNSADQVSDLLKKLNQYAYEMLPAKYLEEMAKSSSALPIHWGNNPVRR